MKIRFFTGFLMLMLAVFISGCSNSDSPGDVAQDFWQAMADGDIDTARGLATESSKEAVRMDKKLHIEYLEFGKIFTEEGNPSLLPTSLTTVSGGNRINLSFDTVLEQQQGQWRVDFNQTTQSMLGSSFQQLQDALAETITEAGNAVGDAVDEALNEAAGEMSEVLQGAAREMQQAADQLREELQQLKQDNEHQQRKQ
ncbi:MAG: hypothetical protein OIF34_04150 [Porticoccaceae bacterium]|nr:hypothetical protein [Porticoccaceae bacterium]